MMTRKNKLIKLAAIILTAALLSSNAFAGNLLNDNFAKTLEKEIPEIVVKNLALGLASENTGLKRSCIYLAGFYEIEGLVKPLTVQFTKESDVNTKIMIVLALYKIGNSEAIDAIQKLVNNDSESSVKVIGRAIMNDFKINSSFTNN